MEQSVSFASSALTNAPKIHCTFDTENTSIENMVQEIAINNGVFEIYNITDAIREYKTSDVQMSIFSMNPIVRMFAVMDRRIGKRTLEKLASTVTEQPDWLQFFYKLRLDADNIIR